MVPDFFSELSIFFSPWRQKHKEDVDNGKFKLVDLSVFFINFMHIKGK